MSDLTANEKQILQLIYTGHVSLCNIVDYLGSNSPTVMYSITKLLALGLIEQQGPKKNDTIGYKLTAAGEIEADVPEADKALYKQFKISTDDVKVLKGIKKVPGANPVHVANEVGMTSMQVVAIAENLEKNGYIKMPGFIRCKLYVTDAGEKVIAAK